MKVQADSMQEDLYFLEAVDTEQIMFDASLEALESEIFEEYDDLFERLSR